MGDSLAVAALVRKRAELAGEVEAGEKRLQATRADLAHLDATIRLLSPGYPIAEIAPKKPRGPVTVFGRGDLIRAVLDILRPSPEPVSVAQLAGQLMRVKAMPDDRGTREFLESRIDKALRRQEGHAVEKVVFGPRAVGWMVRE